MISISETYALEISFHHLKGRARGIDSSVGQSVGPDIVAVPDGHTFVLGHLTPYEASGTVCLRAWLLVRSLGQAR